MDLSPLIWLLYLLMVFSAVSGLACVTLTALILAGVL